MPRKSVEQQAEEATERWVRGLEALGVNVTPERRQQYRDELLAAAKRRLEEARDPRKRDRPGSSGR